MSFQPFHERRPVRVYFTNMPHWRQEGCAYFVTYRLADSIPEKVLEQWEREKRHWLALRGIEEERWAEGFSRLEPAAQHEFLRHFNRTLNSYLDDCHGSCALRDGECRRIVADGWRHFSGGRYELGDLVVMPNHIHLLLTPLPGHELEDILRSRKRQSAREINQRLGRAGAFWQKHSYDHIVRDEAELRAFKKYIAENPAKAACAPGSICW